MPRTPFHENIMLPLFKNGLFVLMYSFCMSGFLLDAFFKSAAITFAPEERF